MGFAFSIIPSYRTCLDLSQVWYNWQGGKRYALLLFDDAWIARMDGPGWHSWSGNTRLGALIRPTKGEKERSDETFMEAVKLDSNIEL